MSTVSNNSTPRHRWLTFGIIVQLLAMFLAVPSVSIAEVTKSLAQNDCLTTEEPNDQYPDAFELGDGAACVNSDNPTGGQDLYRWTVSTSDAISRWTFAVSAIPGQLSNIEIYAVEIDDSETITNATKLAVANGSVDQATTLTDVMLPADSRLVIGVATSGAGAYTFTIDAGTDVPPLDDTEPNDDPTTATAFSGAFSISGNEADTADVIAWTLSREDTAREWTILYQKPATSQAYLTLSKEDGTLLIQWQPNSQGVLRVPHLGFEAGTYVLTLAPNDAANGPYILEATAGELRRPGTESEPNDVALLAAPVIFAEDSTIVSGQLDGLSYAGDRDVFPFTIDADQASRQLDIKALWQQGPTRKVCLYGEVSGAPVTIDAAATPEPVDPAAATTATTEAELICREGDRGAAFDDLILPAGDYSIAVSGAAGSSPAYLIRFDFTREASSGFEAEPNNTLAAASNLAPDGDTWVGSGRLKSQDPDYFDFTVTGEPQLWQVDVTGTGVTSVELSDVVGSAQASGTVVEGVATLYDMFLLPGDQRIVIKGESDTYTVKLTPMGPPDPLAELEPNNAVDTSQSITLFEERTGRLPSLDDSDNYRFSLQNEGYVRVSLTLPPEAIVAISLSWQNRELASIASPQPGGAIVYDAWLRSGDYQIRLGTSVPSLEEYQLVVSALDPFTVPQDLEPNDWETNASSAVYGNPIAGSGSLVMRSGDVDWYRFPALDEETQAVLYAPDGVSVSLFQADAASGISVSIPLISGTESGSYLANIPVGGEVRLQVSAVGDYEVNLELIDDIGNPLAVASPAAVPSSDLTVELDLGEATVAAYWEDGQRLDGTVAITNSGSAPLEVSLDDWTGNMRWAVEYDQKSLTVDAGETVSIPVHLHVAPDAWADRPILVVVRASLEAGSATGSAIVTVDRVAPPINPEVVSPLPQSMQGGLNVAWMGLGAVPDPVASANSLFDERIVSAFGWKSDLTLLPAEIIVDLAGDEPVPVAGFILDPRSYDGVVRDQVRDFEIEISTNGSSFTPVFTGTLTGGQWEHAFALDAPVEATYVKLRVLSGQSPDANYAALGEFKVVADPEWSPSGGSEGLNLADPLTGGHVVDLQPPLSTSIEYNGSLVKDDIAEPMWLGTGSTATFTVGFNQDRAALIERLTWQNIPGSPPEQQLRISVVEVAVDSSTGPWVSVGDVDLGWDDSGFTELVLDTPVWARFVRVTFVVPDADDGSEAERYVNLPDAMAVYERTVSDEYRSIVGEWGGTTSDGIYDVMLPEPPLDLDDDAGNDQDSATLLPLGTTVTNTAWVEQDVDWYQIDAPNDAGQLSFTFTGVPSVEVAADLFDTSGDQIDLEADSLSGDATVFTASVEPGASYYLRVTEPPSNVIFAFDTSGSIGPFATTVYQAMGQYTSDVQTGQEVVNIVPFGNTPLLPDWSGEPYLLQATITNYPRTDGSSDSDGAILTSMDSLAPQSGSRVIVLITDNETSPVSEQLEKEWPTLATVKPRIFAIHIAGTEQSTYQQAIMQDWAMVNSGQYVYVQNQGEMDIAFDRAATILRRPSIYSVTVEASAPPPTPTPEPTNTPEPSPTPEPTSTPEPTEIPLADGSIFVSAAEVDADDTIQVAEDLSVAIIFDTSGSMLQSLDDSTRAEIARDSLIDLVTTTIPEGTSVSLRTFGDEPGSCDTPLVVPQAPLDPDEMSQVIADLPIVNEVKTPIGASLAEVGDDLGTSPGPKIVVLVTDGEETCDGDPAAEIQALIDSGIDVRVNIVGFALDDPALKDQFAEWARIGNGRYIDAGNANELTAAIADSVQPTYDVLDADGTVVASGQVGGDPVGVPPGAYSVLVHSSPEIRIDDVEVTTEQETWLELESP